MKKVSAIGLELANEVFQMHGRMLLALSFFGSNYAGLVSCNSLQLKRRAELRWKPRIMGPRAFPLGPVLCEALPETAEERCSGRRGDPRGVPAADDALRAN
jgi:hypothetical protein